MVTCLEAQDTFCMRSAWLLGLLLCACNFGGPREAPGDGAAGGDDGSTTGDDGNTTCSTVASQFDSCAVHPTQPMSISANRMYNTDTHELSDFPSGNNKVTLAADQQKDIAGKAGTINVILATAFSIAGTRTLRVFGSKSFGVYASDSINVSGLLDASSDTGLLGAGARDAATCGAATPAKPQDHDEGGGGGAPGGGGGAFHGKGGKGQDSDSNEAPVNGVPGGTAIALPLGPRGGCAGGAGGSTNAVTGAGGAGGRGGGAIYLVSAGPITIPGTLHAGGGGGGGGRATDGGGGGGGSGGMILVESTNVNITGILAANGGGGGGGAGGTSSGSVAEDAHPDATAAAGGPKGGVGGDGAPGAAAAVVDGHDNLAPRPTAAGGGGGGGAGYTIVNCPNPNLTNGTFSPALTPFP